MKSTKTLTALAMVLLSTCPLTALAEQTCISGNGAEVKHGECSPLGGYRCNNGSWDTVTTCLVAKEDTMVLLPDLTPVRVPDKATDATRTPTARIQDERAQPVAEPKPSIVNPETQSLEIQVTRSMAREIRALLDGNAFSRETASVLVQIMMKGEGGSFQGYTQSGGWCWNDDGTLYGATPCPKEDKKKGMQAR